MPKLEIKGITKVYKKGAVKALDGFTVTLTTGVYGLLGPNGAGKSTLMNIITDNLNSDKGEVLYDGENIKKLGKNFGAFSVICHSNKVCMMILLLTDFCGIWRH